MRKTDGIYTSALTQLKDFNPCLAHEVITVDFETASNNAFSKVLPVMKPKGSFFT